MIKYIIFFLILTTNTLVYAKNESAIFAGGCFWCVQADFDKLPGVISTQAGYDGGQEPNPTYKQVSAGLTSYAESVKVEYDSDKLSYENLVNYFWQHIDPTVKDQQFCDKGHQYRSAIFYLNDTQKQLAKASLIKIKQRFPTVYTEIVSSTKFYPAEDYHQKYYLKNPVRYKYYRWNCGRDVRIKELWVNNYQKKE